MSGPSETIDISPDVDDKNEDYRVFGTDDEEGLKDEKQFVF